jgi:hypothetical protein
MQYEAARLVTGLACSVYARSRLGLVSTSPFHAKLSITYKAKNGELPSYLDTFSPNIVSESSQYNLLKITIVRRTEIFSRSFIPSAISTWNSLDNDIPDTPSNVFTTKVKNKFKPTNVPKYFLIGERLISVYHARLRNRCVI